MTPTVRQEKNVHLGKIKGWQHLDVQKGHVIVVSENILFIDFFLFDFLQV